MDIRLGWLGWLEATRKELVDTQGLGDMPSPVPKANHR